MKTRAAKGVAGERTAGSSSNLLHPQGAHPVGGGCLRPGVGRVAQPKKLDLWRKE